jgi:hypothetical protein
MATEQGDQSRDPINPASFYRIWPKLNDPGKNLFRRSKFIMRGVIRSIIRMSAMGPQWDKSIASPSTLR